ncbi:hypothetical protein IE81DRAFT_158929 [Ceraceosorus guamensis]|uniref:Uncharacterized protein n=1 Tax=Ceraceosorus guamensis TaxID=1522189 RepID=A0A316VWC2_9BASI|nr:hypothetical protein IE81DRAFT_158929 [Ceraceosorus guamensis]PWN41760.1 hypothetical protein IE81DRAFT_158929 [Ceraceosorus guamensis]
MMSRFAGARTEAAARRASPSVQSRRFTVRYIAPLLNTRQRHATSAKPSDALFRRWRTSTGCATAVIALVVLEHSHSRFV